MAWKKAIQEIEDVVEGLNNNPVANLAYTDKAFAGDDADGVAQFDKDAEQNIPDREHTDYNLTIHNKGVRTQGASIPRNTWNHYIGRGSYNLNKIVQKFFLFLDRIMAIFAHNAFEWDADAGYAEGAVCYRAETLAGVRVFGYYRRNNVTGAAGDPLVDTAHWDPMQNKFSFSALLPFRAPGYRRTYTVFDLTGGAYLTDRWYPAVTTLQDFDAAVDEGRDAAVQVLIEAFCNGPVQGVTGNCRAELSVLSKFTGFAGSSTDVVTNESFVSQNTGTIYDMTGAPIGYGKLVQGRQAVVWLRGGSKYALWNSFGSAFTLYTSSYSNGLDSAIAPQASRPFSVTLGVVKAVLHTNDAVLAEEPVTMRQALGALPLPKQISGGTQLNVLRLPGLYVADTDAAANTVGNVPVANPGAFTLLVQGDSQGSNVTVQKFVRKSNGREYVRVLEEASVVVPWTLAASGWTRADWDEDDPLSPAYILNKPEGTLKLTTSIPDTAVPVKNLTLSPFWREHSDIADGKLLVANRDHFIEIIDITRGEKIATIAVPLNYRYDISKPVNGKILLCGDDAFGVIDTTKGTQTPSWTTFPSGFTFHKMFSEPIDGKVLIASAKTTALLVDISQETPTVAVVQLPFSQAQTISAPVDGRMLIGSFYQSDTMAIIDVTQGAQTAEVVSMPMRIAWDTLSFPVNGKILVGGYSYTIAIVDLTQGTQTAAQVLMPAGPWTTFSLPVDGKILAISGNANLAVVVDLAQGAQTASTIINESDIYGVSDPAEGRLLVTGRNRFWILDMMGSPRLVKAINTPSSKQWATLSRPVNGRIFVAVNDEAFSTGLIIDLPAETMGVVTMPSSAIWNRLFDPVAGKILAGNSYDSYMAIIDLAQQTQIAAAVTLPSGSGTVLKSVPFGNKIAVCRMQSPSIAIVDITKGTQTAITIGIPAGSAGWTTIAGPAAGKFLVYNANDSSYLVVTVQLYPELRLLWNDDILSRIPLTQEVPYGFEG